MGYIVILTAFAEMDLIRQCLAAGADGVLLKDAEPGELILRFRHLAAGTRVIDPRVAAVAGRGHGQHPAGETDQVVLSPRERDVLDLLADGCSNRQIADRLFIAETTVKGYVATFWANWGSTPGCRRWCGRRAGAGVGTAAGRPALGSTEP